MIREKKGNKVDRDLAVNAEYDINLLLLDRFRHLVRWMRIGSTDASLISRDSGKASSGSGHVCLFKREVILCFLLFKEKGAKQKEIADELGVSPSTFSETISRLVNDGYVERIDDAGDRRAKLLRLTPSGREKAEELLTRLTGFLGYAFRNLEDREKRELIRILDKLLGENGEARSFHYTCL